MFYEWCQNMQNPVVVPYYPVVVYYCVENDAFHFGIVDLFVASKFPLCDFQCGYASEYVCV